MCTSFVQTYTYVRVETINETLICFKLDIFEAVKFCTNQGCPKCTSDHIEGSAQEQSWAPVMLHRPRHLLLLSMSPVSLIPIQQHFIVFDT